MLVFAPLLFVAVTSLPWWINPFCVAGGVPLLNSKQYEKTNKPSVFPLGVSPQDASPGNIGPCIYWILHCLGPLASTIKSLLFEHRIFNVLVSTVSSRGNSRLNAVRCRDSSQFLHQGTQVLNESAEARVSRSLLGRNSAPTARSYQD